MADQPTRSNGKTKSMVNQFGVSKSSMVFNFGIVTFLNNYPKGKKFWFFFTFFRRIPLKQLRIFARKWK